MFKLGAEGRTNLLSFVNPPVFAGLALYGVGTVLWIFSLSKAPLSAVYPYTAVTFVLVYGAALVFFGETASLRGVLGAVAVLGGLFLMAGAR